MDEIAYRWTLRKLHYQRSRMVGQYKRLQEMARKEKKPREDIESLISEEIFEVNMIDDEIETLESRYLIESERKFVLPIPRFSKNTDTGKSPRLLDVLDCRSRPW